MPFICKFVCLCEREEPKKSREGKAGKETQEDGRPLLTRSTRSSPPFLLVLAQVAGCSLNSTRTLLRYLLYLPPIVHAASLVLSLHQTPPSFVDPSFRNMTDVQPVVLSYHDLLAGSASLPALVQEAFDSKPESLGLLIVKDLPEEFKALRKRLLLLSNDFASLPEEVREKYTHPASNYSYGWSHGKEIMNGKPDTLKGSFYNNPTSDLTPGLKAGDEATPNIWPKEESLEGYEKAFKALCSFMVNIGLLVGGACDQLVGNTASNKSVKQLLEESHSGKARLLHYFPRPDSVFSLPPSSEVIETKEEVDDSWCGLHKDHGLLTVLCPSMYLFHSTPSESTAALEPLVIPAPSPSTGLFIKTRGGEIVQAKIPEDCVALQTGETLQLLTANRLAATPHFVNATASTLGKKALEAIEAQKNAEPETWGKVESGVVSRETLAVFLQPNHDEVIAQNGESFGEFTTRVFKRHYADADK